MTDQSQKSSAAPTPTKGTVRLATVESVAKQPRSTTETALKGYHYLKNKSTRARTC